MERPRWMPADAWRRLEPALRAQPSHAADALSDLRAVSASWDAADRSRLLGRVADRAVAGTPLPAALMLALCEALDER